MLQAALAFAVAMILLSTIATGIVEILLRVLSLRQQTLRRTMASLFDSVVWPRMERRLGSQDVAKAREVFVDAMTKNPAFKPAPGASGRVGSENRSSVDRLSPVAFAERLGRTEIGSALLAEGEKQVEVVIQDFVRSFERFGRAASEVYRKKAQLVSIGVGIVLALCANVEVGRLFTAILEDPDLRASLIASAEEAKAANDEALASLEAVSSWQKVNGDQAKILREQVEGLSARVEQLQADRLPIGWSYFPRCEGSQDPACTATCAFDCPSLCYLWKLVRWLALTVAAGILIGLGGPFWFRVFTSLSQIAQVLRAVGVGRSPDAAKPEEVASADAQKSATPHDVVDAFRTAAAVSSRSTSTTGATPAPMLLGPDGQTLR